jgi:hypothetical protein
MNTASGCSFRYVYACLGSKCSIAG